MYRFNLIGPICSTGIGVHYSNILSGLADLWTIGEDNIRGLNRGQFQPRIASSCPVAWPFIRKQERTATFLSQFSQAPGQFDPGIPTVQWNQILRDYPGSKQILSTVWETSRPPRAILDSIERSYRTLVPTVWHVESAPPHVRDKLIVLPEPVGDVWPRTEDLALSPIRADYLLVSIGKFEKRKGVYPLIDALGRLADDPIDWANHDRCLRAATYDATPIRVLAFWNNPFVGNWLDEAHAALTRAGFELLIRQDEEGQNRALVFAKNRLELFLYIDKFQYIEELYGVVRSQIATTSVASAGIFPFFAEGWCLPIYELASMGTPSIFQRYSGPRYMPPEYHYPIELGDEVIAKDGVFFHGDSGTWRELSADKIYKAIRSWMDVAKADPGRTNRDMEDAVTGLHPPQVAGQFLEVMQHLLSPSRD